MAIIKPNNNTLSAITSLPAGAGGKILQVVTFEKSSNSSTTNTSYTDTGLTVDITPSSTSSKIFVIANLCSARTGSTNQQACNSFYNLVRGSTELTATRLNYYDAEDNTNREVDGVLTLTNLDEPNTTSATTYKCQMKAGGANITTQINQTTSNTPNSSITVMEIAG